jgi:hypothetical protein
VRLHDGLSRWMPVVLTVAASSCHPSGNWRGRHGLLGGENTAGPVFLREAGSFYWVKGCSSAPNFESILNFAPSGIKSAMRVVGRATPCISEVLMGRFDPTSETGGHLESSPRPIGRSMRYGACEGLLRC